MHPRNLDATIPQHSRGRIRVTATAEADSCGPSGLRHARPVDPTEIARVQGVRADGHNESQPRRGAPDPRAVRAHQPLDGGALRGRHPSRRGTGRRRRAARRPHRQAHRALARGQVHRQRARLGGEDLVGPGQPADQRGALRAAAGPPDRVRLGARPVQPGLLHRRGSRPSALAPRLHGDGLGEHLRAEPVPPALRRAARRLRAQLHDHLRALVPGRSGDRGHTNGDRDPGPPAADGGDHRRHRVRRRDQEVGVHGDELPDARRGRPADALGDQRRCRRRCGGLLRAVGDRQDDPLGGPAAQPDRRRRARLGRRDHVQLRGRLLRQDDPPLPDVRAGHLPDHAPVRDDPRERRPRPGHPRARSRLGAVHREHPGRLPARLHRQRRPDRDRRLAAGGRVPDRRRVRRAAADRPPDPRAGRLSLHQRLHGQARRHRGRGQGAQGDVLGLLRGAVHAPPPGRVRRTC